MILNQYCNRQSSDLPSKVKTIIPNFLPGKKDGLHEKDDQRTVTVSPVVRVPVELQHPPDVLKLEDESKRLAKPALMIECITEEADETWKKTMIAFL
ncbi:hypothetical protein TNCT_131901 [Trichonephila clavata]|uniref:Uncharacterized protein n=1 Tax=Trichonephila clavata TaxID=2740835 RepID=A0A8X6F4E8_TRICU|nr:hypothetical protein TNCT_131901 [Trichonephila clavata]